MDNYIEACMWLADKKRAGFSSQRHAQRSTHCHVLYGSQRGDLVTNRIEWFYSIHTKYEAFMLESRIMKSQVLFLLSRQQGVAILVQHILTNLPKKSSLFIYLWQKNMHGVERHQACVKMGKKELKWRMSKHSQKIKCPSHQQCKLSHTDLYVNDMIDIMQRKSNQRWYLTI